jgi:TRAP-type C4-dicarboxylate transport system permease small subunit
MPTSNFSQVILCTEGNSCETKLNIPKVDASESTLASSLKVVFGVIAVIAVIYVAYAGFKYVTSQGDSGAIAKAKSGIIYGILGLVVALAAFSVVAFTIGRIAP